jgi:cell division protein FtsL
MLQGWFVINHKSSNCLASKGNPHKLPVKNLINLFRREKLLYLKVIALVFCVLGISILYSTHLFHHQREIRGIAFNL